MTERPSSAAAPPVLLFPGMGSEAVGMSRQWEGQPQWEAVLDAAEAASGQPLRRWMREGPEVELKAQRHSPNAILAHSVGMYRAHRAAGLPQPAAGSGYSLGYFSALVAAETVGIEQAMELVRTTEDLADARFGAGRMGMAFVIGLTEPDLRRALAAWPEVILANVNGTANFSLSGPVADLEAAVAALAPSCLRSGLLPVRQPLHSRHMEPLVAEVRRRLQHIQPRDPSFPLVSMWDGRRITTGAEAWEEAVASIGRAVLWPVVATALRAYPGAWLECGAGNQLAHLTRWLVRERIVASLQAPPGTGNPPWTGLALPREPA